MRNRNLSDYEFVIILNSESHIKLTEIINLVEFTNEVFLRFEKKNHFVSAKLWISPVVRGDIGAVLFGIPMKSSRGKGWQEKNTDYNY